MEFNELISDFATRHNVDGLEAQDGAVTLEIDGIIVSIAANGDELIFSADIGEPPAEGAALFANVLLEANLQSEVVFAKNPDAEIYIIVRRLSLRSIDDAAFDVALETVVNQTETWRRLLADFRPAVEAATESEEATSPSFGSPGFIQV